MFRSPIMAIAIASTVVTLLAPLLVGIWIVLPDLVDHLHFSAFSAMAGQILSVSFTALLLRPGVFLTVWIATCAIAWGAIKFDLVKFWVAVAAGAVLGTLAKALIELPLGENSNELAFLERVRIALSAFQPSYELLALTLSGAISGALFYFIYSQLQRRSAR
jgi:hypothetical protein